MLRLSNAHDVCVAGQHAESQGECKIHRYVAWGDVQDQSAPYATMTGIEVTGQSRQIGTAAPKRKRCNVRVLAALGL